MQRRPLKYVKLNYLFDFWMNKSVYFFVLQLVLKDFFTKALKASGCELNREWGLFSEVNFQNQVSFFFSGFHFSLPTSLPPFLILTFSLSFSLLVSAFILLQSFLLSSFIPSFCPLFLFLSLSIYLSFQSPFLWLLFYSISSSTTSTLFLKISTALSLPFFLPSPPSLPLFFRMKNAFRRHIYSKYSHRHTSEPFEKFTYVF